jgi:hypothetical protein
MQKLPSRFQKYNASRCSSRKYLISTSLRFSKQVLKVIQKTARHRHMLAEGEEEKERGMGILSEINPHLLTSFITILTNVTASGCCTKASGTVADIST